MTGKSVSNVLESISENTKVSFLGFALCLMRACLGVGEIAGKQDLKAELKLRREVEDAEERQRAEERQESRMWQTQAINVSIRKQSMWQSM